MLRENEKGIIDQAIWALANIAADSSKYRDRILSFGAIEPLIKIIETSDNKNLIRNGVWALTNLVRGYPPPKYELTKTSLPIIAKVLQS